MSNKKAKRKKERDTGFCDSYSANKIQKIENFLADNYVKIIFYFTMPAIVLMIVLELLIIVLIFQTSLYRLILSLGLQIVKVILIIDLVMVLIIPLAIFVLDIVYNLKDKKG